MRCKELIIGFLIGMSINANSQDSVYIEGFFPRGLYSKSKKLIIDPKAKYYIKNDSSSEILLKTNSSIFLDKIEILNESRINRKSDTLEIELIGFRHDYLVLTISINRGNYQMKFKWNSEILPEYPVIIQPKYSFLKLSSDNFSGGSIVFGYLEFKALCKGKDYEGKNFDMQGFFKFKVPLEELKWLYQGKF